MYNVNMKDDFDFQITVGRPKPKELRVLIDGLLAHHAKQGHPRRSEVVNIFLKDKTKKVVGAVIITILWNGMDINSLWVDESLRGKGWGRKLMLAAEAEGKKRGCTLAYTNTFTWQAPKFYEKLGYSLYGKLDNYPTGSSLFYYQKKL